MAGVPELTDTVPVIHESVVWLMSWALIKRSILRQELESFCEAAEHLHWSISKGTKPSEFEHCVMLA